MEEEAREYLEMLKKKLLDNNQEDKYREFRNIMKSFKLAQIGPERVISEVQALFDGQNDLIAGFSRFLPRKHAEILNGDDHTSPSTASNKRVVCGDPIGAGLNNLSRKRRARDEDHQPQVCKPDHKHGAVATEKKDSIIEFINRVRRTLNDEVIVKEALDAMARYKTHRDLDCVDKELLALFKATPELHIEFTRFTADAMTAEQSTPGDMNHKPNKNRDYTTEQKMDWCEDYMFEHDLVFNRVTSATKSIKKLQAPCERNQIRTSSDVNACVGPINLRCIEYLKESS